MSKKAIKKTKGFIISNPEYKVTEGPIQLLRITIANDETKIDFGYQAGKYEDAGWIHIRPTTFLRPKNDNKLVSNFTNKNPAKFLIKNAINIPFGPAKHIFNSKIEWSYFSLYFPLLPEETEYFDLIEGEFSNSDVFNFFDIKLKDEKKKYLIY